MSQPVSYELSQGVATLAMDDGKANVMSSAMLEALAAALDRAQADKAVVLLQGREGLFSGGFDLGVFRKGGPELGRMLENGARLAEKMLAFPRPIVAACTGHAVAMGAFLLLGADLRIGCDQGLRVHVNELQIGLTLPRFAIELLRLRLSPHGLRHAALLAAPHDPAQAVSAGFLSELAPATSLLAVARERALALTRLQPAAFVETKQRINQHAAAALAEAVRLDVAEWRQAFGHAPPEPPG